MLPPPLRTPHPPTTSSSSRNGGGDRCRRRRQQHGQERRPVKTSVGRDVDDAMQRVEEETKRQQRKLRKLEREYRAGKQEHTKNIQLLEKQRTEAALRNAEKQRNVEKERNDRREAKLVEEWRAKNARLRMDIQKQERERDALILNIRVMKRTNEDAKLAISNIKSACIRSSVRHNRLVCEGANALEEAEVQDFHRTSRRNLLDVEVDTCEVYSRAIKKLVKLVQKRMSDDDRDDSTLKADVTRVATLYLYTENRRRCGGNNPKGPPDRYPLHLDDSFQSVTSVTELCDDEL